MLIVEPTRPFLSYTGMADYVWLRGPYYAKTFASF